MKILSYPIQAICFVLLTLVPTLSWAAEIDRFAGTFLGQAEVILEGESQRRDLSTTIEPNRNGFNLSWTSVTYRADGSPKTKTYAIEFVPTERDSIYGSAMKTNMFGKQVPLDPLQGEPFVWSRFDGDTFSVFSLFINETGEYELQEYHRTLTEGGLNLLFRRVRNGVPQREIKAFLKRQG